MSSHSFIRCPRCKSFDWIVVETYQLLNMKTIRCLDCRRTYTVDFKEKRIIPKDIFGKERRAEFRAHCPECGSYNWRKTSDTPEPGKRDFLCVCGIEYTVDYNRKRITVKGGMEWQRPMKRPPGQWKNSVSSTV